MLALALTHWLTSPLPRPSRASPCRANKRWDDASVSPVIRQTLLHWAFELTEEEFDRMRGHL